tara:strand:+ start:343 stop:924 length:582 start_codon:yes stop_codon:yes gene_type:complete
MNYNKNQVLISLDKGGQIIDGCIPVTKEAIMKRIQIILDSIVKFPIMKDSRARKAHQNKKTKVYAFTLGKVRSYSHSHLVDTRFNRRFIYLHKLLDALAKKKKYEYTTIQINRNVETPWHKDKRNIGMSYCLGLGNYPKELGGLDVRKSDGTVSKICNKNIMHYCDGHIEHRTTPDIDYTKYTRYAIIWFKHV